MKSNLKQNLYLVAVIFGLTVFVVACNTKTIELPIITPANLIKDEFKLSDVADEIVYLKLDNKVLLSVIKEIKKSESGYFISTADGLFNFDNEGKFKLQIGKKGKGPAEYTYVDDFAIDNHLQLIYILNSKRVLIYNFSGEFVKTFPTPNEIRFQKIYIHNNILYFPKGFGFNGLETEWITTDTEGHIINSKSNFIRVNELKVDYLTNLCFEAGNNLFYWNQLNDTIFQIGENIQAAYLFANDKFRVTKSDLILEENFRNKTSWQLLNILGSQNYLTFDYILLKDMKRIYTLYNRRNKKIYELCQIELGKEPGLYNSFDGGPCFIPRSKIYNNNEEWFVNWIDAFQLKILTSSDEFKNSTPKYPEKKTQLEKLANSLDENDNPVLMLVKLKE